MPDTDVIEAEATEVESAVAVYQPVGLAAAVGPDEMIALASQMATSLRDIVERQHLYAVIQGKKFPQVEAWMTIARMDNVVAREVSGGILRLEDGAYEATVELIRLSDGLVIGRGSALCGSKGDRPWDGRPEPARRSMAVTRATSRAFRQQYSWIMALAGYEPTPAEEMPRDDGRTVDRETGEIHPASRQNPNTPPTEPWLEIANAVVKGTVSEGKPPFDLGLREQANGEALFGFKLAVVGGKTIPQVVADGPLASDIADASVTKTLAGQSVIVHGDMWRVPWDKAGVAMPAFQRMKIARIVTPDWTLPNGPHQPSDEEQDELDDLVF